MTNRYAFVSAVVLLAMTLHGVAADSSSLSTAPLRVVATTEDLASLVREVGGDRVEVSALAKGTQDPHFVDPKPSFIALLSRADLLVVVGRELELGWLPPLQTSSRNEVFGGSPPIAYGTSSADVVPIIPPSASSPRIVMSPGGET